MSRKELSTRSAGVRRLLQESRELEEDQSPDYTAAPLESDLFTWHFTIRGPGGDFEGGIYHGKMVLPSEYPFKPPEVYMLTPSGRFETQKKICLSISSFHPESWQPSWGIRSALIALMAFFSSDPKGAVGSLDAPPQERRRLAKCSRDFQCPTCGFDASSPECFPSATTPTDSDEAIISTPDSPNPAAAEDRPSEASATIFPAPRSGMPPPPPSPHDLNMPNNALSHVPVPTDAPGPNVGGAPRGLAQPQVPMPAAVVQHHGPMEGAAVGVVGAGVGVGAAAVDFSSTTHSQHQQPGAGEPLLIDRAILVVLLALLACIVRKIA